MREGRNRAGEQHHLVTSAEASLPLAPRPTRTGHQKDSCHSEEKGSGSEEVPKVHRECGLAKVFKSIMYETSLCVKEVSILLLYLSVMI